MNRIDKLFRTKKGNILSIFFTAGFPRTDSAPGIIRELADAGADMIEIGIPFSDPLADGPVIQGSSLKALRNGMSLNMLFDQLKDIRRQVQIPLVLMGYINPVFRFGIEEFCRRCSETGIDGVILPDLPPEIVSYQYPGLFEKHGLCNILLISPRTPVERVFMIDRASSGFIYMVSSSSTTGIKSEVPDIQKNYFRKIKELNLKNPLMAGFGISDRKTFRAACESADGAIIGSAFVRMLGEKGADPGNIRDFIRNIL